MAAWDARPEDSLPGATPIDLSGLKNRALVRNRADLADAEALNINRSFLKYLAAPPSPRAAPFDYAWFLKLHAEMFGDVWTWAGVIRRIDLNLGVPPVEITERLAALSSDLHSWSGFGHALETQATWLHHKAVQVHPFENGNGRWARLLANIWLKQHGASIVAWPDAVLGIASEIRGEYLRAVRAADGGDYALLGELHRRFTAV